MEEEQINKLLDRIEYGFTIKEQIHDGYCEELGENNKLGKYHYILESDKGMISLIELPNYYRDGNTWWEIYSFNDLFTDVMRFATKEEAIAKAKEYLCP